MVRRSLEARFMPGVWVFPGGTVDAGDAVAPLAFGGAEAGSDWKVAALRELIEETGLWLTTNGVVSAPLSRGAFEAVEASEHILDPGRLIYFSNWITPSALPLRFDTRFFLTVAGADVQVEIDGEEVIDFSWITPLSALQKEESEEWIVSFPTRETLLLLATEATAAALSERFTALNVIPPVQPRIYVGENEVSILMLGDDGFDEAGEQQHDVSFLNRLALVVAKGGRVPAEMKRNP